MKCLCWLNTLVLLLAGIIPATSVRSQDLHFRQRGTNPTYQEGDWVSYSVARFVSSIAVGRDYIYFGTRNSGITRYHQFQSRWDFPWTTSNGLADNEIWAVAYDFDTNYIWCASHRAVSYYRSTARQWQNAFKDEFGLPFHDEIVSIGIGRDKILFESRAGRQFETGKFGGPIILADKFDDNSNGELRWFGHRAQRGVKLPPFFTNRGYLFNAEGIIEDSNFRRAEVVAAVEDQWGNMWIATWGLGAGRGDVRTLQLDMLEFGLANATVDALTFMDDVLWMAGSKISDTNRGITAWDLDKDIWFSYEQRNISELLSDRIHSISLNNDTLLFSTDYGLSFYYPRKGRWLTIDRFDGLSGNIIFDAVADDSTIWVATESGIDKISKKSLAKKDSIRIQAISPESLLFSEVRDLELVENLLWAATNDGIYVYDTSKDEGGFSVEFEGPLTETITSISRYENEIWFGSARGLDVFDFEKREWLGVPEGRAFPNKYINVVLAAKEAVWAATNSGVMKYDRASKYWRTFTTADGLIDNRVYALLLDGDYIWFGTELGLTQFYWNDPSRID
ncbi:MAG: hypothetical protein E2O78_09250 [Caldithrix sp.]|nr:MAG: hypothetical protein E2O78_09250 [Caldithrix sp.]